MIRRWMICLSVATAAVLGTGSLAPGQSLDDHRDTIRMGLNTGKARRQREGPRQPFLGTTRPAEGDIHLRSVQFARRDEWIVALDRGDGDAGKTTADDPRTRRPSLLIWDGFSGRLVKRHVLRLGVA